MDTNSFKRYLAGMVDADGHMSWRGSPNFSPILGVTNVNLDLHRLLVEKLGGSYSTQRRICADGLRCREKHIHRRQNTTKWHISGQRVIIVLRNILPFMIVKADKAKRMMQMYRDHFSKMQRPERRNFHIHKEEVFMKVRGWE